MWCKCSDAQPCIATDPPTMVLESEHVVIVESLKQLSKIMTARPEMLDILVQHHGLPNIIISNVLNE